MPDVMQILVLIPSIAHCRPQDLVGNFARTLRVAPGARELAMTRLREIEKMAKRHGAAKCHLLVALASAKQRYSAGAANDVRR